MDDDFFSKKCYKKQQKNPTVGHLPQWFWTIPRSPCKHHHCILCPAKCDRCFQPQRCVTRVCRWFLGSVLMCRVWMCITQEPRGLASVIVAENLALLSLELNKSAQSFSIFFSLSFEKQNRQGFPKRIFLPLRFFANLKGDCRRI